MNVGFHCEQGRRPYLEDGAVALTLHAPNVDGDSRCVTLLLVLDGAGGPGNGDMARDLGMRELVRCLVQHLMADTMKSPEPLSIHALATALTSAMVTANEAVNHAIEHDPSLAGMASTVVAACIVDNHIVVSWVGDSRLYVCRDGYADLLTHDHARCQELIDAGVLSPQEAMHHPEAHIITRHLGQRATAFLPDVRTRTLTHGDIVCMCSDGLLAGLPDEQLAMALSDLRQDPQITLSETARVLTDLALRRGSTDNISVLLYEHDDDTESHILCQPTTPYDTAAAAQLFTATRRRTYEPTASG